jgi:hypothetical protein
VVATSALRSSTKQNSNTSPDTPSTAPTAAPMSPAPGPSLAMALVAPAVQHHQRRHRHYGHIRAERISDAIGSHIPVVIMRSSAPHSLFVARSDKPLGPPRRGRQDPSGRYASPTPAGHRSGSTSTVGIDNRQLKRLTRAGPVPPRIRRRSSCVVAVRCMAQRLAFPWRPASCRVRAQFVEDDLVAAVRADRLRTAAYTWRSRVRAGHG